MAGALKLIVKKNQITPTAAPIKKFTEPVNVPSASVDTKERMMNFKFELDVKGKMRDEVISELTGWVDDAVLLGVEQAVVVHGRGSGVLKDTVRAFLRKYKEVESVSDGTPDRGGDFVTVVKFRL
jgi:DNA mismatch repair protein MutS2